MQQQSIYEPVLRDLLSSLEDVVEYLVAAVVNDTVAFDLEKLENLMSDVDLAMYALQTEADRV